MSVSGSVPTSIFDFVSSRCSAARPTLDARTCTSRRAATRFQYARSTFATVSATVRFSDAAPRSLSRRAIRIARRAGSTERFWRSGWRRSMPIEVPYEGESRARKLFVRSRAADAERLTVPPVGRSAPREAVPETPSLEGASSFGGAPERREFAGSV